MSDPVVPPTYTYPLPRIASFLPQTNYSASEYHHDFQSNPSCMDVTVTLVSRDKILFCVRASALKTSSSVFEAALSQKQQQATGTSREPVIDNLHEDVKTIEGLLRMITGRALPPLDTLESIALQEERPLKISTIGAWRISP
ncbi:hypothetical protein JB92DRAFT_3121874 [Gautieria morchelliformis]|nr:hypothetical protein JB92DRAFT_3121874 [Gautieria morchelliformis]